MRCTRSPESPFPLYSLTLKGFFMDFSILLSKMQTHKEHIKNEFRNEREIVKNTGIRSQFPHMTPLICTRSKNRVRIGGNYGYELQIWHREG